MGACLAAASSKCHDWCGCCGLWQLSCELYRTMMLRRRGAPRSASQPAPSMAPAASPPGGRHLLGGLGGYIKDKEKQLSGGAAQDPETIIVSCSRQQTGSNTLINKPLIALVTRGPRPVLSSSMTDIVSAISQRCRVRRMAGHAGDCLSFVNNCWQIARVGLYIVCWRLVRACHLQ